jgi:hypothetical protein
MTWLISDCNYLSANFFPAASLLLSCIEYRIAARKQQGRSTPQYFTNAVGSYFNHLGTEKIQNR